MGLAEILSIIASIAGCITAVGMVYKAVQWIRKKTKKPAQRGPRDFLLSRPDDIVSSDKSIYHSPSRAVKYVPPPGDRNYDPNRDPNRKSAHRNPPKHGHGPNQPRKHVPPPGDRNYDPNRDPNRKSAHRNPPPKHGHGPNQPRKYVPPPGGPPKS